MPHCQELKNQITEIQADNNLQELLSAYQESGDEDVLGEFEQQKSDLKERLNSIDEELQKAVDKLMSHHSHAEVLDGKFTVQNGSVIAKKELNFLGLQEVYLPSVIDVAEEYIRLNKISSAEDLELPEKVEGSLYLNNLTLPEDLELPEEIGGDLNLNSLTSAKDLEFPEKVDGDLYLRSLTSAIGLRFPDKIGGNFYLTNLTSAEGLRLPRKIEGFLNLGNLTSAEGLDLSGVQFGSKIYLENLPESERESLREEYPRLSDKIVPQ